MSDKRFVKDHSYLVNYDKYCILDKVQHKHLYLDEVCKKLNEQQSTINELQSIINHIKCEEDCFDYDYCCETVCSLFNEIKHLKEENEKLKEIDKDKEQDVLHLYKKNEQLKQKLKKYEDKEFEQTQMRGW